MNDRDQILSWIEAEKSNIIGFLQDFIRAKSPNPPGDTTESANVVTNLLDKYEVPYRIVAPQPTMPNILGTF